MKEPLVSVIIPNYNYARFLRQSIDSALAQTYPNLEVIVVDDGSTDDSLAVLATYGSRIRCVTQSNRGVSEARNRGVLESRGGLLAFLDSDDIWLPSKIEKQVRWLLSDPEVGLVHTGCLEVDAAGRVLRKRLDGMEGWVAESMLRLQRPVILGGGSAVLVTKAAFNIVGGFDPLLPPAEDWDFYFRVASNFKVGFVPEYLLHYREHGSNGHLNLVRMEESLLLAFDKAFRIATPELRGMKRACYGKLHSILAGSYFRSGSYLRFSGHLAKSLFLMPSTGLRMLGFPSRWWRRRRERPPLTV